MEVDELGKEMQELRKNYETDLMKRLKEKLDSYEIVKNYLICTKEGTCKANNFEGINEETVSIMAATLYAAANTANSELKMKAVQIAGIESGDDLTIIFPVDDDNILLFLDVDRQGDLEKLVNDIKATSKSQ